MRTLLPLGLFALLTAQASPAELEIQVQGLRNANGQVRLCLTRNPAHFPDCNGDPAAVRRSLPARAAASIHLRGVPAGVYALSVIHDENGDGRLNRFMAIPREGFGFSRNPVVRFGAPKFRQVDIKLGSGFTRASVRMQYLL